MRGEIKGMIFLDKWPFEKKSIRRISIDMATLVPGTECDWNTETNTIFIDENDYDEIFDEIYELISAAVSKIKLRERLNVEIEERLEFKRLKSKYGG
jgi:hypothetical protein